MPNSALPAFTLSNSLRPCEYSLPTDNNEVQTMANPEHLKILKEGVDAWKKWRANNPGTTPDLVGADLSRMNLCGVHLGLANLPRADLSSTNLGGAYLGGADLT